MATITKESTITCPDCGQKTSERMSTEACQYFWRCTNCNEVLKPQEGDCCVFCSYGDTPCPPVQQKKCSC